MVTSAQCPGILSRRRGAGAAVHSTPVETILVVDADAHRREGVARVLAARRPGARLLPAASWAEVRGCLADGRPTGRGVGATAEHTRGNTAPGADQRAVASPRR